MAEASTSPSSLTDQSLILALEGRALFYHSAPFEHDTELTGFFRLSAWISIDCPDTDFYVSIHEIAADGSSVRLTTDALRARYREGLRSPKLVRSLQPLCYDFERFTFVSREVRAGSRLRLMIAPIGRVVESCFTQKNYNTGGVVCDESAAAARAVTVKLFHDSACPSVLYVPLGHPETNISPGIAP